MIEVTGIDHIYIAVSDLSRSEIFYDRVLLDTLGFKKNKFTLGGEPHIQGGLYKFKILSETRREENFSAPHMFNM
jgi:glyoxylase I family protein